MATIDMKVSTHVFTSENVEDTEENIEKVKVLIDDSKKGGNRVVVHHLTVSSTTVIEIS